MFESIRAPKNPTAAIAARPMRPAGFRRKRPLKNERFLR